MNRAEEGYLQGIFRVGRRRKISFDFWGSLMTQMLQELRSLFLQEKQQLNNIGKISPWPVLFITGDKVRSKARTRINVQPNPKSYIMFVIQVP